MGGVPGSLSPWARGSQTHRTAMLARVCLHSGLSDSMHRCANWGTRREEYGIVAVKVGSQGTAWEEALQLAPSRDFLWQEETRCLAQLTQDPKRKQPQKEWSP